MQNVPSSPANILDSMVSPLSEPIKLPCGLELSNRLCKVRTVSPQSSAMRPDFTGRNGRDVRRMGERANTLVARPVQTMESRTVGRHSNRLVELPHELFFHRILRGKTPGNVQVDVNNLGTPFDPALRNEGYADMMGSRLIEQWSEYAATCQEHGTPCLVQLCHPGRQSLRIAGRRGVFASTVAPSSVPLQMGGGCIGSWLSWLVFPPPREMTRKDIECVSRQFIDAARLMAVSGFSGIELHGAHGYLIGRSILLRTN